MALVIETGAIVTGANSFVSESELDTYADNIGVTITGDAEILLVNAAIFIASRETSLLGSKVDRAQEVAYPRSSLTIDGFSWSAIEIPTLVKTLQMALALEIDAGIDLYNPPDADSKTIKRVRVEGAIEVEYAVSEDASPGAFRRRSLIDGLFKSLTGSGGNGIWSIIRV